MTSRLLLELLTLATFITLITGEDDIVVCGGVIKSTIKIPFSDVKVGVFSEDGVLKESTECAPHNGYFLLPLYSKGRVSIRVLPPAGWTFHPDQIVLDIDGESDPCSRSEDLNFVFQGFTVSGRVVSKGLDVGPSGVTVSLTDKEGAVRHEVTDNGDFSISKVMSGVYTISLSHSSWKMETPTSQVEVGMSNLDIEEPFAVLSYDVRGVVQSSGQPIAGVEVKLTPVPKSRDPPHIEGCMRREEGGCVVVSDSSGQYYFPSLAPGKYSIAAQYSTDRSTFHVSPSSQQINVVRDTVVVKVPFTVNGFAVMGRVVNAVEGGEALPGVQIYVNGDKVAITDSEGHFELTNVTSGQYEVIAKLKGYYFTTEVLDISPHNPVLPDITANAYQLCGTLTLTLAPASSLPLGQRKVGLRPSGEDSNAALVTTSTDGSGAFCFKVSPGKYTLQALIGAQEHRDGLRLVPEREEIEVTNGPRDGVTFTQRLSTVSGSVECISGTCSGVKITLTPAGGDQVTGKVEVVEVEGRWSVGDVLPGEYQVKVENSEWCWKESKRTVTVSEDPTEIPAFIQSGYIMKLEVSHATQLNFSVVGGTEEKDFGTFSLEQGTNRFCLKKPGTYRLVPYSCHKFEQDTYQYSTSEIEVVTLTAVQHLMKGTLQLKDPTGGPLNVSITNTDTQDKTTLTTTDTGVMDEEGYTLHTYTMWSPPGHTYLVKPLSDTLLFTPVTRTAHVGPAVCPTVVEGFSGTQGTFITGKVSPPVQGVLITLTSPDNDKLKLTQITDETGQYSIGPLHNNLIYQVSAAKVGYDIVEGDNHDFTALKLSKLTISVKDGENVLSGVLVAVSSTKGYRNNVVLEDRALLLTGLVPGDYYIRPLMKEYQFTPGSKTLAVSEGLEVEVEIQARRVSYSCYGKVTTLNGSPSQGIVVEAVGTGDCGLVEEGVTGADGVYRIRGLTPNCPITISVRSDKSEKIRRASPKSRAIQVLEEDSSNVNFIVFHEPTTFDITGYVEIADEYVQSTKVILIEESRKLGKKVHSSILDQSRLFIFPEMDLSHTFTVKLESTLSPSMYNYKIPDVKIKSEGPFQHKEIGFYPIRKNIPQEQVTRASFTAVAVIVLSMVLAANHATLVPVFTQVYHSVMTRNNGEITVSQTDNSGLEYIDDVHKSGIRRGKSRKR